MPPLPAIPVLRSCLLPALAVLLTACASAPPQPAAPASLAVAPVVVAPAPLVVPVPEPVPEAPPVDFPACREHLQQRARDSGLAAATVDGVLGRLQFQPGVIALDRRQPEVSETFQHYLSQRVTEKRIRQGQALGRRHAVLLQELERDYGVPAPYLLAFWGLETDYGGYLGKLPVLDALATLACDGRRREFFTGELLEALHLVEDGIVTPARFTGSWAGAVGQLQFMPGTYRRYGVDADGSGQPDLWRSLPDALTSAAHYLHRMGWQKNQRWGREVQLPAGFDYAQAALPVRKSLAEWRALGVTLPGGEPLPSRAVTAAILVPAGHQGPALLVYDNFDVIMKWNRSEFYALSVGYLADRIRGAEPLHRLPPPAPRLKREQVQALQAALNAAGFDAGAADGVLGSGTKQALRAFQQANGMIADGYPAPAVLRALGVSLSAGE